MLYTAGLICLSKRSDASKDTDNALYGYNFWGNVLDMASPLPSFLWKHTYLGLVSVFDLVKHYFCGIHSLSTCRYFFTGPLVCSWSLVYWFSMDSNPWPLTFLQILGCLLPFLFLLILNLFPQLFSSLFSPLSQFFFILGICKPLIEWVIPTTLFPARFSRLGFWLCYKGWSGLFGIYSCPYFCACCRSRLNVSAIWRLFSMVGCIGLALPLVKDSIIASAFVANAHSRIGTVDIWWKSYTHFGFSSDKDVLYLSLQCAPLIKQTTLLVFSSSKFEICVF